MAARSHIKFTFDRSEPESAAAAQGRLLRAPTPYPKELKELAKHARNLQKLERRPRHGLVVSPAAAATLNSVIVILYDPASFFPRDFPPGF